MGNIKNTDIKKTSVLLVRTYPDKFSRDYSINKAAIKEMGIVEDKKVLNQLAGSVTRLVKINAKGGLRTTAL